MEHPFIDILLPTCEPDPRFLRETIESLLNQTEQRWVCTIRDDASSRHVQAIVEPYMRDPRIRFVRNERRLGIGGNWNACLSDGNAPFVQYLFHDDTWDPRYLSSALAVLQEQPRVGFVAVEHRYVCEEGIETARGYEHLRAEKQQSLKPGFQNGQSYLREWLTQGLRSNLIGEPSFVMIRRSAIQRTGLFAENLLHLLDAEYWFRLLRITDWWYMPKELGNFRVHRNAASFLNHQSGIILSDYFRCLENVAALFPVDSEEKILIAQHADNRFVDAVSHAVNQAIRGRYPEKNFVPVIRYLMTHPQVGRRATRRYGAQAIRRWRSKALRALPLKRGI